MKSVTIVGFQVYTQMYEALVVANTVLLSAIEIEPVARVEHDALRSSQRHRDPARQAMERELTGNPVRRKGGAAAQHEMDGFELLRLDQRGRMLRAQARQPHGFAGFRVMKRHDVVPFRA